jgi:hypothetical protein
LEEDNSPDEGKPEATDREEQASRLKERRSELVGSIKDLGNSSSATADSLESSVDEAVSKYGDDEKAFTEYATKVEASALKSIQKIANRARTNIESAASYFRIYLMVAVLTLVAVGIFGGYLFVVYFPPYETYFFAPWAIISAIIIGDLLYIRSKLSGSPASLEEDIEDQSDKVLVAVSEKPVTTHDLTPLKRFAHAASSGVKGVTVRTVELLTTDSKLLKHETKVLRQERFIGDFIFALRRYEVDVSREAKEIMITKTWLLDDVPSWLDGVSKEMAAILNLDSRLFELFYYEFFDAKYADKLWSELRPIPEMRQQISRVLIQRKLVEVPDHPNSLQAIDELLSRMPNYSLEEARSRTTEFFSNLSRFKEACCAYLDYFGLEIVEKKELLLNRVPKSSDPAMWRDDIISYISQEILSKSLSTVKLLILSSEGDEGTERLWSQMREEGNLKELASVLAIKRIRPKFANFRHEIFLAHTQLVMRESLDDFSLAEIQSSVDQLENDILTAKYRLQHTVVEYRLGRYDAAQADSYVPPKLSTIEALMLADAAKEAKIDGELFQLLHSTANGLPDAQDRFQELVGTPRAEELAKLLIEKSFVAKSKFNSNLVALLRSQSSFTTTGFVSAYARYEALMEGLDNLVPFLEANGVLGRPSSLNFQEVLEVCPVDESAPLEVQLERVTGRLVKNSFGSTVLNEDQHSDLALAAAAIFMRTHGYTGFGQLCQRASRREFAPKVMFQYITLVTEESLSGNIGGLEEAVSRALKGVEDLSNFNYFRTELQEGKLAPSAALLFSQFKKEIKSEFKKLETRGFDTKALTNYLDPIRDLLYSLMDERVVREFLLTQVLSAYLLTVPGGVPGITFLEEGDGKYIRMAQEILAASAGDPAFRNGVSKGDRAYRNMVQLATGGGKATRIGLVPLEMGFDEFSVKFNEVWSLAVELYNSNEPRKVEAPLPCYLIRIFPSDDGLKEIMRSQRIETRPLEVVRGLIRDSTTQEDAVSLLSLMQKAANGRLALAGAIAAVIDGPKSSLLMLAGDQSRGQLSKSDKVLKWFTKREVDKDLLQVYQAQKMTELGIALVKRVQVLGVADAQSEFGGHMLSTIGATPEIAPDELSTIAGTIFQRLLAIGRAVLV